MAARRGGLGKGLDSLISPGHSAKTEAKEKPAKPEVKVVEKIVEKVVEKPVEMKLKISEIEPNREQPRKSFDEDGLIELSESIKQFGVLEMEGCKARRNQRSTGHHQRFHRAGSRRDFFD